MAGCSSISMLVSFGAQKRPVTITEGESLDTIERNIYGTFKMASGDSQNLYQIQFYDAEFQTHIDLCSATSDRFLTLLQTLLVQSILPKNNPEWHLKLVGKTVIITQVYNAQNSGITNIVQGAPVVDLIEYPLGQGQDDWEMDDTFLDTSSILESNEVLSESQNLLQMGGSNVPYTSPSLFDTDNFEGLSLQSASDDDDYAAERETADPTTGSNDNGTTADPPFYNLRFKPDLAHLQRLQTQAEAIKRPPNRSIGGCLLQASEQNSNNEEDEVYPRLKYDIPANEHHLQWKFRQCVLTQADGDGNHYFHPTKGILDEERTQQSIDANDSQTVRAQATFVYHLDVKLSFDDVKHGAYEIRTRVFNLCTLSERKHVNLNRFSEICPTTGHLILAAGTEQRPSVTLSSLNLNHKNYHLAAMLLQEDQMVAFCISRMMTEGNRSQYRSTRSDHTTETRQ